MTTPKPKLTTKQKGLGERHEKARESLLRNHKDGTKCSWCGRPMYRDVKRNWDYDPEKPKSGKLHAHHSKISRAECLRRGIAIPPPDELLHATCNIQLGDGGNKHLAAATKASDSGLGTLTMDWPW